MIQGPCKHPTMGAWYVNRTTRVWRRDCLAYSCGYYETWKA